MAKIDTVVFDLGGVLVDWNPYYLYRKIMQREEDINLFFQEVCTSDWNEEQDAGRSIVTATQELVKKFPDWERPIRDFYGRWKPPVTPKGGEKLIQLMRVQNRRRSPSHKNRFNSPKVLSGIERQFTTQLVDIGIHL